MAIERERSRPVPERPRRAADERVEHERGQRELVHRLRLTDRCRTEVAGVLAVGNVGLGDEHDRRIDLVETGAEELHDGVGLGEVDRGRALLLPEERHGIESDRVGAGGDVRQEHVGHPHEHGGVPVVEVDLVGRERRPHRRRRAVGTNEVGGDRRGPRSHDGGEVGAGLHLPEEAAVVRVVVEEGAEPVTSGRRVVDDRVGHHVDGRRQLGEIVPRPVGRIDRVERRHAEATIARRRVERQDVHTGDLGLQHVDDGSTEGAERSLVGGDELGRVRDHPRRPLVPRRGRPGQGDGGQPHRHVALDLVGTLAVQHRGDTSSDLTGSGAAVVHGSPTFPLTAIAPRSRRSAARSAVG